MVSVGTSAFVLSVYLVATRPGPKTKKEIRKTSWEKLGQSESKLFLKVCFGVERALAGTPPRRVPFPLLRAPVSFFLHTSHVQKISDNKR